MKLPVYIKKAIRTAGYHNAIASKNSEMVRNWLEKNAPDTINYWEDELIDSLELTNDGSESLIQFLENDENMQ